MKRITGIILPLMATTFIFGCSDDDDNRTTEPETPVAMAAVRVIHGSADAPMVNIKANGALFAGLEKVDYLQGSGFIDVTEGSYDLAVDAVLPDGTSAEVLSLNDAALAGDTQYTVLAHGTVAEDNNSDNDLGLLVIANPKQAISTGNIRLQVVHAAPNAPTVDVHLTAPGADLGASAATLGYGEYTQPIEVAAGSYQVRLVLPQGSEGAGTVAYDLDLPQLDAGQDWFIAALPNTGVATSPVVLLANNGTDTLVFNDKRTEASIRVAHSAADVPQVDILANGTKVDALSGAAFGQASGYLNLAPGEYQVDTVLTSDNSVVGISGDLTLTANQMLTVAAVGTLATESPDVPLEYLPLDDSRRRVATEAQLRLTHAHPAVGNVDIYVTADGVIDNATPAFTDVAYKATTGWVSVAPGDYVVSVTATGTKTVAIETPTLSLAALGKYSALAVDNPGATPANLLLMDDFVSAN
ncbi:DUF4397 domain-containing protein [Shewanella amazonensis]|uniref:DUF4397 domain-containing protein n=1 Tax=Shewanella amazonensis (strain ATCC BAA-1098 / SB2B) TaxID=326297 RepID=A1SAL9_SHEAM|nr:DUF4397 domain-containing protein [Shewanella amazonensis]ABM01426.1 conserved hypothetical protein [Shewanella amazonensis SB2B]